MQIVIEISEYVIEDMKECGFIPEEDNEELYKAIVNGTVLPDNATNGEWVDVDERLPEDAYGCLVTVYDTDLRTQDEFENLLPYFVGYDGETWNNFCGEPIPFEVVAWMKLPTPYQKGGKVEC